jgi:predicted HTH transcriptional regulator
LNVGLNVGLNKTERKVLSLLIENANSTAEFLSAQIGVTKRTVERTLAELQKKGRIERIGSKRDGFWKVF